MSIFVEIQNSMKKITILFFILTFLSCKKNEVTTEPYNTEHTIDWMQDLIKKYPSKNISLKDICMPRAHDAAMYEVNNCYAGNACNTKTQYRTMKSMLESGIRVFDVRPVLKDGVFWTYHATHCEGFGCDGVLLKTFLDERGIYPEFFAYTENGKVPYLSKDHAHYAEELAIAVEVWTALAENPSLTEKKSPKKSAQTFLSEKFPTLSENSKERISTLINWSPAGGAPKT